MKLSILPMLTFLAALCSAADGELKDSAGKTVIKYVVETPENMAAAGDLDPTHQVGLILCFPEHDRPVGDEIYPVREALKRQGLSGQYVLLAGGPQERKFGPADHQPIQKLIQWALKTYPINPRRIYMYGKGEGGKISGEFAMFHPQLVTASITYSWGWWTMPAELTQAIDPLGSAPEFYMVLGLRDLSYHLTTVRDAYSRVSAKGYHVIYREFEDLGARTYHPTSNDDAISWVTKLRNKNVPPSPQEVALLRRFEGKGIAPVNGYFPELALVGGAAAGAVVEKLLHSEKPEVRAAAAQTCEHAVFPESTLAALANLTQDTSATVRQAAIRALAIHANWRSETAQHALIALATGPQKAVVENDRVDAVDGIIRAAKLQIRGARQDPDLFKALVALLTDPNEQLKTMAANTLAPIRDPGFRGDLGRTERKEPEAGWTAWLNEVSAKAAGYRKDYAVCATPDQSAQAGIKEYCAGGRFMRTNPALAFENTLKAAQLGFVPAQTALGMLYAIGKGTQQDYAQAAEWWTKASAAGDLLAATNLSMVYRGAPGVKADPAKSAQWAKFVADHSGPSAQ